MTKPLIVLNDPYDEDWIKTLHWDLPTDLEELIRAIGARGKPRGEQVKALKHLMTLPAWKPAPPKVRDAVEAFIAG